MHKILKIHKTIGMIALIPLLFICLSGIVLSFRNQVEWLSPKKPLIAKHNFPRQWLTANNILEIVRQDRGLEFKGELKSIVYNINDGFITLRTLDDFEYNIEGETGKIISKGVKRSLFFNRLHQDLLIGKEGKTFIVLPAAIMLLFLLFSGGFLILLRKNHAKRF